jgi:SAM-dependent methyltransferase
MISCFEKRVTACRSCGSPTETLASGVRDYEYGAPGEFEWRACAACGLVGLSPEPSPELLALAYPPTYHAYLPPKSGLTARLQELARALAARRFARLCPTGGSILEIGCSHGQLLAAIGRSGDFRLFGVEYAPAVAEAARARGIEVWQGEFADAAIPTASIDLAIMQHVLEHLPSPQATLAKVRAILRPGAFLVGEVPNIASWDARLFGRYWGGGHAPRHLWHFTPPSLRATLAAAGFDAIAILPSLHTGHWALSFQNLARRSRRDTDGLTAGRSWYYPLLLVATIPINLLQMPLTATGVMRFSARRA